MTTTVHFLCVGQGNMTLLQLENGAIMLYDCNVTDENEDDVLSYLGKIIGLATKIDIFVNSHRDADHMRGIKKIHDYFPIQKIWDSGVTGGSPESNEYKDYMDLRRKIGFKNILRRKRWGFGKTKLRVMNSKNDDLPNDPNAQSIVIKVEHHDSESGVLSSVLLAGDTNAITWKDTIMDFYGNDVKSDILLASHHGSISFFDDPGDSQYYYTKHIQKISPTMTVISVGDNSHGHPHDTAIELYEKFSKGTNKGTKIRRTDQSGNIKVTLKNEGGWTVYTNQ